MHFIKSKTGIAVIALIAVFAFLYFFTGAFGNTRVGITITTNPELEDGLVAHYTFDGNLETTVEDRSPSNITGYFSAGAATSSSVKSGKIGQGISLDGTDDYIVTETATELNSLANTDTTVAVWVKFDSFSSGWNNIYVVSEVGGSYLFDLYRDGSDLEYSTGTGGSLLHTLTGFPFVLNQWYHITAVHDNANTEVRLYVDGVEAYSASETGTDAAITGEVYIGAWDDDTSFFDGDVDDLRFYDRALSPSEITRLYGLGATTKVAKTITTNDELKDGLVAHWTFDGVDTDWASTTAEIQDASGNGNSGEIFNDVVVVSGKIGQAVDLDGTDDYIESTTISNMAADDPVSIAAWIYPRSDGGGGAGQILSKSFGISPHSNGWIYGFDGSGFEAIGFEVDISTTNLARYTTNYIVPMDEWSHIVLTWDGSNDATNVKIYINDVEATYDTPTSGVGSREDHTARDVHIGANSSSAAEWDGYLDDVRLYNKELSRDEVSRLYGLGATTKVAKTITTNPDLENGLIAHYTFDGDGIDWSLTSAELRDKSVSARHGNINTNSDFRAAVSGKIGQAHDFEDDGMGISISNSDGLLNNTLNTVAMWIKPRAINGSSYGIMVDHDSYYFNLCHLAGDCNSFANTLQFYHQGDTQVGSWSAPANSISFNEWQHVAVTYDRTTYAGSAPLLYINGEPVAVTESATPSGDATVATGDVVLADSASSDYDGAIDDLRFYDRILSPEEIKRLYQLGGN